MERNAVAVPFVGAGRAHHEVEAHRVLRVRLRSPRPRQKEPFPACLISAKPEGARAGDG